MARNTKRTLVLSLLVLTLTKMALAGICLDRKALVFKAKYEIAKYHGTFPQKLKWVAPLSHKIGHGFSVEAHGQYPLYSVPMGVDPVVFGPGLPKKGKRLNYKWINGQVFQFDSIKSSSGASQYTIEFFGGVTTQSITPGPHVATWTLCYDGPFKVTMMELPKEKPYQHFIPKIPWDLLKDKIKKTGVGESCDLDTGEAEQELDEAIDEISSLQVPREQLELKKEIIENLVRAKSFFQEAGHLVEISNGLESSRERTMHRNNAIQILERARAANLRAIRLASTLEL